MSLKSCTKSEEKANLYTLEVSISAEKFEEAQKKAFAKMKNKISLPGFRKGKVTRAMAAKFYGEGFLYEDALDFCYGEAVEEAIKEAQKAYKKLEVPVGAVIVKDGKIISKGKKVVFIVESEQMALKFRNDLSKCLSFEPVIFPYQDGSIYDSNSKNLYKYAQQISIINNPQDFIIVPFKALFEKFPQKDFFENNALKLKKNIGLSLQIKNYG